jgi:hypothetical protein
VQHLVSDPRRPERPDAAAGVGKVARGWGTRTRGHRRTEFPVKSTVGVWRPKTFLYLRPLCPLRPRSEAGKALGESLTPKNIFPRPAAASGRFGRAPDSSPGPTRKVDRIKHFPETCVRSVRSVRGRGSNSSTDRHADPAGAPLYVERKMAETRTTSGTPAAVSQRSTFHRLSACHPHSHIRQPVR